MLSVEDDNGDVSLKPSYSVLRCETSDCKANFWNRDVNAARNMLAILKSRLSGRGIPADFRRGRRRRREQQ